MSSSRISHAAPPCPAIRPRHLRFLARLLPGLVLATVAFAPVHAALSPISEEVTSVHRTGSYPDVRAETRSLLTFASASSWETDPDNQVLTMTVTRGVLEVLLAAGHARIDRHAAWLAGTAREPVVPGKAVALLAGDSLVVMDGYLLRITNRNDSVASAVLHRVQHE